MEDKNQPPSQVSLEQTQLLMEKILLPTPRAWLVILALAILLSLFEVTRTAEGTIVVNFHLTTITAVLLGLIWLPFLLKVIALGGGGLKTLAGEVTMSGLWELLSRLDPGEQREALPTFIATVEAAESKVSQAEQPKLREIRQELESRLVSLSPDAQQARKQLQDYAQLYEVVRRDMPSSTKRTLRLSSIVAGARALAKQAGYGSMEVSDLFAGDSEGARIVSLAIVQALPHVDFFELVLQSISHSRSAFEQYQALQAMEHLLPLLNIDQKRKLADVLRDQRSGGPGKFITQDSDRWLLSSRMLDAIQQ